MHKTEITKFFNNNEKNSPRDIGSNLLMARLLGQRSKEDHSAEMKEQAENRLSFTEFASANSDLGKKLDFNMWHSVGPMKIQNNQISSMDEDESIHRTHSEENVYQRSEMVYEFLSQFKTDNKEIMSKKFLAMSSSPDNCIVLRQSGCLPLLIQLIHGTGSNATVREHASQALHSIVQHNTDEKQGRREGRILNLIEQLLEYCNNENYSTAESPAAALSTLMKLSFDVEQRHTMCQFGALQALAKMVQIEHARKEGDMQLLNADEVAIRRYAAMSLTNLTCGDSTNKALLCSMKPFMFALVAQLRSPAEELCQVTAGVLRNLSWRADTHIKETLRQVDATKMLMQTVMRVRKESTLKAILAALWNLSAHSDDNKVDICNVDDAIEFLVIMLSYQAPSGSLIVIENVGGILRNVSKLIAVKDEFRAILRDHNCLQMLLQQLKSPSLVIVSNACGTLWNLTARSTEDQCTLIQLGAVDMLRSLTHSKHKMISIASTAALKNLMSCCSSPSVLETRKTSALAARKERARERDYKYLGSVSTTPGSVKREAAAAHLNGDLHCMYADLQQEEEEDDDNNLRTNSFRKVEEPYNVDDAYGDHAETDLDQPTNYSLKFSEHVIDAQPHSPTPVNTKADETHSTADRKISVAKENLPLETPLMFSRSSSFDSVSTCGEAVDDQHSVVSEFSRAVSGIVSPSDLPDSPTQTVPPTPRPQEPPVKANTFHRFTKDVFEDEVTVFKDECTPILFSVATSLSSLNFEDETYPVEGLTPLVENRTLESKAEETSNENSSANTTSASRTVVAALEDDKEDSLEVDLSLEEQQAIVEACIVSGKPSSTPAKKSATTISSKIGANDENVISNRIIQDLGGRAAFQSASLTDSTVNYCTEDTPVSISHAASNSDLSLLCPSEDSFLQNSILPLSSCLDSVELSTDEQENLLNQCIAKGKQSLSYSNQNSLDDNRSSQSSTLSEITEDLPMEDRTLIKDISANGNLISSMTTTSSLIKDISANGNLISSMTTTSSITDNEFALMDDIVSKDLSEEEEKNLLNQCIALGMRSMKDSSDLENIGPPSFLAEANLDNSLTNVEEITDYVPHPAKFTPKQKRRQIKDRYNTYTVKHLSSPTKTTTLTSPTDEEEANDVLPKKPPVNDERRLIEKDRFKTRTLSKNDFEEIVKCQNKEKTLESEVEPVPRSALVSSLHKSDESTATSDTDESYHERVGAKIVKPMSSKTLKSGIPIVNSKLPKTKVPTPPAKKLPPSELPVSLQRQNTFTKEESSSIPIRRDSVRGGSFPSSKTTTPTIETTPPFRSGIPSRIKESSSKLGSRVNEKRSPDIVKNHRWSMSENNLNATSTYKGGSSTSLNSSSSSAFTSPPLKANPSASQSALPVRRESAVRNTAFYAYK